MAKWLTWIGDFVLLPLLFIALTFAPVLHTYLGDAWGTKVATLALSNLGILMFVIFMNLRSELRQLRYDVWLMHKHPPKVFISLNNGEPMEAKVTGHSIQ